MKYLKSFLHNETRNYITDPKFKNRVDDVKDICLELQDDGFLVKYEKYNLHLDYVLHVIVINRPIARIDGYIRFPKFSVNNIKEVVLRLKDYLGDACDRFEIIANENTYLKTYKTTDDLFREVEQFNSELIECFKIYWYEDLVLDDDSIIKESINKEFDESDIELIFAHTFDLCGDYEVNKVYFDNRSGEEREFAHNDFSNKNSKFHPDECIIGYEIRLNDYIGLFTELQEFTEYVEILSQFNEDLLRFKAMYNPSDVFFSDCKLLIRL